MKTYTTNEQAFLYSNCNTATELLEIKTTLEETQILSPIAILVYNIKMQLFLTKNQI